MKIRQGFVSNSSSSSFVVAFDKKPKNVDEVRKLLFGDKKNFALDTYSDKLFTTRDAAEAVFNFFVNGGGRCHSYYEDVKDDNGPLTREEIVKEIEAGWMNGVIEHEIEQEIKDDEPDYRVSLDEMSEKEKDEWRIKYDAYDKKLSSLRGKKAAEIVDAFLKNNEGKLFFVFSFSDNDGAFQSALEHDCTFDNLPHLRISHH